MRLHAMIGRFVASAAFGLTALVLLGGNGQHVQAAECAEGTTAEALDAYFSGDPLGLVGADYPHAYALPDGRRLWLFQDAFWNETGRFEGSEYAHNGALVQTGNCFERLSKSGGSGTSWIGSWVEQTGYNWFWPLDAEVGSDGHLWLFLAGMQNDADPAGGLPSGTWRARLELPSLRLVDLEPASDSSRSLFGYSIVSDHEWTYLFANCYRQFTSEGFDPSCSPQVYLARVPKGDLGARLEYWTGAGWSDHRSERQPVMTGEGSLAASVERFGDTYVAVYDEKEWSGSDIVVSTAKAPYGPWSEVARFSPETKCQEACNNYGPFVLPSLDDDRIVIAHSNNAWDMTAVAIPNPSVYRFSVRSLAVPGIPGAPLPEPADDDEPQPALVDPDAEPTVISGQIDMRLVAASPPQPTGPFVAFIQVAASSLAVAAMASAALGVVRAGRIVDPSRRRRALARIRTQRVVRPGAVVTERASGFDRRRPQPSRRQDPAKLRDHFATASARHRATTPRRQPASADREDAPVGAGVD